MSAIRVILAHVLLAVHARIQFTHFSKRSPGSSVSCAGRESIFEMKLASSVQCMVMCTSYNECKGVSYNMVQHLCKGYNTLDPICSDTTTQFFIQREDSTAASTYSYIGCFKDDGDNRAMRTVGTYYHWLNMTNDVCYNACRADSPNNAYFATQNARDCFCAGVNVTYNKYGVASDCGSKCEANASQICGGTWRNSVYSMNASSYSYIGCFVDTGDRAMLVTVGTHYSWQNMTNDVCYNACRSHPSHNAFFGTQNGVECYCAGAGVAYNRYGAASGSDCSFSCEGNTTQKCGGPYRNSVYCMNT